MTHKTLSDLRSRRWFAARDMRAFAHRQRVQQMGLRREDVLDRPCIAIINTWSELSPCHAHLRERAEAVKRGILMACLLYTSPSPRDRQKSRMPSSA